MASVWAETHQGEIQELEDLELVERVRAGDERCLETLLSRYRNFARTAAHVASAPCAESASRTRGSAGTGA